ncbi:MAG: isoprenylcysteine carboxylmethyltransferase family protein [Armatimonadota bacterium]
MILFVAVGVYLINRKTDWLWVGMVVTFFGELMQLWAASHLRKDKALATSGPYSYIRNPMYFGRFFVLLGFIIMIQQAWWTNTQIMNIPTLVVGYIVLFALYVYSRVGREEDRLRGIFGEDYINYCKEVRRFLPRLTPYPKAATQRLQWSRIVANHEYLNMVAVVFVFGLIVIRLNLKF